MIGVGCCIACILPQYFSYALGHDQISYLIEAKRALSGDQLYGRFLAETNPPLIIWFSAIPVALSHNIHHLEAVWFRLLVFALVCGSIWWSVVIVRRAKYLLGFEALLLFTFALVWAELPQNASDFGQREHLLLIFLLPYILAVATRASKRLPRIELLALGLIASAGIWFKPHNILVVVALQLFLCAWEKSYRPIISTEFLGLIGGNLLLLGATWIFAPLYFTGTLPVLRDTYWALGTESAIALARDQHFYNITVVLFAVFWLVFHHRLRNQIAPVALLVCSCVASIAFDIQHVPWGYHKYPQIALMEVAIAYVAADLLDGWHPRESFPSGLRGAALILGLCVCLFASARVLRRTWRDAHRHDPVSGLDAVLTQCNPKTPVYVFSTSVPPMAAAYRHDLTWASRFAHLWMMPALAQNELGPARQDAPYKRLSPLRLAQLSHLLREDVAEDLNHWKPALVLVERCTPATNCTGIEGKKFDTLGWFQRDPGFAREWAQYQQAPSDGRFDVYTRVTNR